MDDAMDDELLVLTTAIERPKIAIDEQLYELTAPEELTILEGARIAAFGRKLDALLKLEEPTEADQKRLEAVFAGMTGVIMRPVPAEIRAKLTEAQQLSVIEAFTLLLLASKTKRAGAAMVKGLVGKSIEMALKEAGSASSRDASASTAATPGDG